MGITEIERVTMKNHNIRRWSRVLLILAIIPLAGCPVGSPADPSHRRGNYGTRGMGNLDSTPVAFRQAVDVRVADRDLEMSGDHVAIWKH